MKVFDFIHQRLHMYAELSFELVGLMAFVHFCRCQLGQRKSFEMVFQHPLSYAPKRLYAVVEEDFSGVAYGPEYLSLGAGDLIEMLHTPCKVDPEGWSYGRHPTLGCEGWYPPTFVTKRA